jgi:hypothetical protein
MSKRTHKTWTTGEIQIIQNSNWRDKTKRQKSQFSKSLERTVSSIENKYRSLSMPNQPNSYGVDLTKRTQKVAKSTYDQFMNGILNKAKSATIEGSKIHVYFH